MRALLIILLPLALSGVASAQLDSPDPDEPLYLPGETPPDVIIPDILPPLPPTPDLAEPADPLDEDGAEGETIITPAAPELPPAPDYSRLPPRAEQDARLEDLFARLGSEEDTARAGLIAEEIWAIWQDSGSASVNYLLVRADAAQKASRTRRARRLFDRMVQLEPDYAEAYARSARLALDEENYNRAIIDATEALRREPRHFYALWTLGNVLERLGREEAALDVYEEAHALFPKLGGVKERLDALRASVLGEVL